MTKMLEKAISEVRQLSEIEQDEIAQLILGEIEDERRWDAVFAHPKSPLLLEKLLAEAEGGLAEDCDPIDPSRSQKRRNSFANSSLHSPKTLEGRPTSSINFLDKTLSIAGCGSNEYTQVCLSIRRVWAEATELCANVTNKTFYGFG